MARQFADLGFEIVSTAGTAKVLEDAGLKVQRVYKLAEGRPNTLDLLKNREIQLVINTPTGQTPRADEVKIRTTAVYTGTQHHDDVQRRPRRRPGHRRPEEERLRRQDHPGISLRIGQFREPQTGIRVGRDFQNDRRGLTGLVCFVHPIRIIRPGDRQLIIAFTQCVK